MPNVTVVIQLLVAPVVLISACGLLCLALYNRLAAVVSRLRSFHLERFDTHRRLAVIDLEGQTSPPARLLRDRLETLDTQMSRVLGRAHLLRNALICLIFCVLCMLGCSLAIGLSLTLGIFKAIALAMFVLGVVCMSVGMVLALVELTRSLEPVMLEQESLARQPEAEGQG